MMVMPLGPDYIAALGSTVDKMGVIAAAYGFAAAAVGFCASFILDRFERKKAILFCLMGLLVATFLTAFTFDLTSMILARVIAGAFGGPLSALTMSMITDTIPIARRGAAIGKVVSMFSIAAFLGVPFGLELSALLGWQAPFITLAGAALIVWLFCRKFLPEHSNIITKNNIKDSIRRVKHIISRKASIVTLTLALVAMSGMFLIVTNISAHLQLNLKYPREFLSVLYLVCGFANFFATRLIGKMLDLKGVMFTVLISCALMIFSLYFGFINYPSIIPVWLIFLTLMVGASARNVAMQTLSSKVPNNDERGTYFAITNTLQNLGISLGAYISSTMLLEENGKLVGMSKVGIYSLLVVLALPLTFMYALKLVNKRNKAEGNES